MNENKHTKGRVHSLIEMRNDAWERRKKYYDKSESEYSMGRCQGFDEIIDVINSLLERLHAVENPQ